MNIPQTVEDVRSVAPGIHLVKIIGVAELKDKEGKPKKDKEGWPGIEFTLQNSVGEQILFQNYYCDKPEIVKADPKKKCKSEFLLTRFKKALGFNGTDALTEAQVIGKFLFVVIGEKHMVNEHGKPITNNSGQPTIYYELVKEFFPAKKDENKKWIYPEIPGNPAENNGVCGGLFRWEEKKIGTSSSYTPPATQQTPSVTLPGAAAVDTDDQDF